MSPPESPVFRPPPAQPAQPTQTQTSPGDDLIVAASTTAAPIPRDMTFKGRDGEPVRVHGRLLAFGTSERDSHSHPVDVSLPPNDPGRYASRAERCSACRWFEVNLVRVDAEIINDAETEEPRGRYLVVTAGRTIVPGEVDFRRAEFTDSPHEVVELLVQHRQQGGRPFIPQTSARVLAHAAAFDAELRDAYLARSAI